MKRSNIVFILIDDMGWMDLGCYGSSFYETPNLDRLAQQSMRFTNAYAACPVCSPTRASLMSGKYPATVQITNYIYGRERGRVLDTPYLDHLPLEEKSLATALREGGYATWHVGKWHLGREEKYWPEHHGFEVNIGGWAGGGPRSYWVPYQNPRLPDGPTGENLTDRLTDEAIRLIENRDPGAPGFFLNLWYYDVHIPIQPKPALKAKYERKAAALGLLRKDPFETGEPFPCEHKKDQRVVRRLFQSDPGYAAMVQTLDENIGRLLAALDRAGIADETIVIFTSDNGGLATAEGSPTCNAPLNEGKGWMYEGGTREPLIVRWPGVTAPDSLCDVPVTSPDFYPTLLEAAGLDLLPAQHTDGVSFAGLLRGEISGDTIRAGNVAFDAGAESDDFASRPLEALYRVPGRPIFWHYPHYGNQGGTPGCSVRAGDWKLIEFFEDGKSELYNLREDVGEDRDLAADRPEIAARLKKLLHDWLAAVDAKIPTPNPEWRP